MGNISEKMQKNNITNEPISDTWRVSISSTRRATPETSTNTGESIPVDSNRFLYSTHTKKSQRVDVLTGHTSRVHFMFKYKVTSSSALGKGGYGVVYAGQRRADKLPVAIKCVPKSVMLCHRVVHKGKTHKVPKEVILMYKAAGGPESVGKSSAVSLLDWYDLDREVLLVMERPLRSTNLCTYLYTNGPMTERNAKLIMRQLVDAAIDMHSKGIFHRDIKPDNILIQPEDLRARIIDFGCACIVETGFYSRFIGTLAYIPPECKIIGKYQAEPTTVWQLAGLLFELLNGIKQFSTQRFLQEEIVICSTLSKHCRDFLNCCLTKTPADRATLKDMRIHPWLTE